MNPFSQLPKLSEAELSVKITEQRNYARVINSLIDESRENYSSKGIEIPLEKRLKLLESIKKIESDYYPSPTAYSFLLRSKIDAMENLEGNRNIAFTAFILEEVKENLKFILRG